ncbi:MAG: CcmD family protein [Bacteroidota bacterium]
MKIVLSVIFALMSNFAVAQSVEMADQFRSDGKIYVVIAVIGVLLAGFFIYLFVIDKKISKLEKSIKEKEH